MKTKTEQLKELLSKPKSLVLAVRTCAAAPTDDQMGKIKAYLLRDFSPDELYIRQMYLANDQHDRSREKFDIGYLKRFADTIVGKSVLTGHDHGGAAVGRFYDAEITRDAQGWNWVAPWFYMPISPGNQLERDNIDSGVWSYVSIGANVDYAGLTCDICQQSYYGYGAESDPVCRHFRGEVYDGKECTLTWDSSKSDMSKVEAVEGSIVYLGCQYNAAIAKSAESIEELTEIKRKLIAVDITPSNGENKENVAMNTLKDVLASLSAEAAEIVNKAVGGLESKVNELEAKVAELEPLAKVGEALRADLEAEVLRLAGCLNLGDAYKSAVPHYSVDELKTTREALEKQWAEKRDVQAEGEHVTNSAEATTIPADTRAFSVV